MTFSRSLHQPAKFTHASSQIIAEGQTLYDYFLAHFGATDFDSDSSREKPFIASSYRCGDISLAYTNNKSFVRVKSDRLPRLLFTFNLRGQTLFRVDSQTHRPSAGAGLIMAAPDEGDGLGWVKSPGEGNFITADAESLLKVAKAMNGPLAVPLLKERLRKPLQFIPFEAAAGSPYARSVIHSLQLVDGLLAEGQPLPRALCLDDLIQRQLVLMLCPELAHNALPGHEQGSEQRFSLFLEWLREHRHEAIGLTEMEQRSGYSRRSLQKKFHNRFGCGPMQWLRHSRLELALDYLQRPQPGDCVSSIAQRCGYINLASFSRDFGARYGRRPSDLLRASLDAP